MRELQGEASRNVVRRDSTSSMSSVSTPMTISRSNELPAPPSYAALPPPRSPMTVSSSAEPPASSTYSALPAPQLNQSQSTNRVPTSIQLSSPLRQLLRDFNRQQQQQITSTSSALPVPGHGSIRPALMAPPPPASVPTLPPAVSLPVPTAAPPPAPTSLPRPSLPSVAAAPAQPSTYIALPDPTLDVRSLTSVLPDSTTGTEGVQPRRGKWAGIKRTMPEEKVRLRKEEIARKSLKQLDDGQTDDDYDIW